VAILRHQLFLPSETFISEQARALCAFAPLLVGRVLGGEPQAAVPWHVPQASAFGQLRYVLGRNPRLFLPRLSRCRPVLIHAHFGVEAVYGMELANRLDVPLVTTFHGFDATLKAFELLRSGKVSWVQYLLRRMELKGRGALFIAVSGFIQSRLVALGFPADRISQHYIGVDTAAFESNDTDAESAAGSDGPVILHVARLVEKKGTMHLLDAFAQIAGRHDRARLAVIGAGPLRAALEARATALGVGARVRWLGAVPHAEVRRWLRRAAVFCLPSCTADNGDAEGLGQVLLEAAASGVPVVGTHHGGIPEAVVDGTTGYLVRERDVGQLADALDALLSSADLRRQFGAAARRFVRDRFDLHTQTRELERLYQTVL
jgi:glycosyltransferase involved in cell wall biosynthesis